MILLLDPPITIRKSGYILKSEDALLQEVHLAPVHSKNRLPKTATFEQLSLKIRKKSTEFIPGSLAKRREL